VVVSVDIALHTTVGRTVVNIGLATNASRHHRAAAYATHLGGSELELIRADRMKKVLDAALVLIGSARKGSSLAAGARLPGCGQCRREPPTALASYLQQLAASNWPTTRRSFRWRRSTPRRYAAYALHDKARRRYVDQLFGAAPRPRRAPAESRARRERLGCAQPATSAGPGLTNAGLTFVRAENDTHSTRSRGRSSWSSVAARRRRIRPPGRQALGIPSAPSR